MSKQKKVENLVQRVGTKKCSKAGQFRPNQYGECHKEENGAV